jgi:hypothetical protein
MKINIAPYRRWIGPYQIAEKILFWKDKDDDAVFALGEWLDKHTPITEISAYFFNKRKVEIRIDPYDTWSMDHTLGLIIVPMLKQLKATKHGSPSVSDADVPEDLRSPMGYLATEDYDVDDNYHKRWDWVMDEMIWAFEQIVDETSDDHFFDRSVEPYIYDKDGHRAHMQRIDNGIQLFGKYYQGLWD